MAPARHLPPDARLPARPPARGPAALCPLTLKDTASCSTLGTQNNRHRQGLGLTFLFDSTLALLGGGS